MKTGALMLLLLPYAVLSAPYVHPYYTLTDNSPVQYGGQDLEIDFNFNDDEGTVDAQTPEESTDQTPTTVNEDVSESDASGVRQIDSQQTYYAYPTKIPFRGEVVITNRERKKQERIRQIKNTMIKLRPNPHVVFNVSHIRSEPFIRILRKLATRLPQLRTVSKNIAPSCMTPMNTPLSIWEGESRVIKLYFNLESLDLQDVNVQQASLKLYKRRLDYASYDYDSEDRIRVSAYRYKNALRKNRQTRRLLEDSLMLSIDEMGWVSLDLKRAVEHWFNSPTRNYGLEIAVEDQHGNLINSEDMFISTNCTDEPVTVLNDEIHKTSTTTLPSSTTESNETIIQYLPHLTPSFFAPKLYVKLTSGHINSEPTVIGEYDEDVGVRLDTNVLHSLQISPSTARPVEYQDPAAVPVGNAQNPEYVQEDADLPTELGLTGVTDEQDITTNEPDAQPSSSTVSHKRSNRRKQHHRKHRRSHKRRHHRQN